MENERRKDYKELLPKLDRVAFDLAIMKSRFDSEYGNDRTEGNIYRRIDELKLLVKTQNSRIGKLENWRWMMVGSIGIISSVVALTLPILLGSLDKINESIKENNVSINKHIAHPNYHENVVKDIAWLKNGAK